MFVRFIYHLNKFNGVTKKQEIVNKVNAIEDDAILNKILNLIKIEAEFEELYVFTENEENAVNEESKELSPKWLKEQSSGLLDPSMIKMD